MSNLTREQFYEKYGDVLVKFVNYYKYKFTYHATLPDGRLISVDYGGTHDQIYRHEVHAACEEKISALQPYAGNVYENGAPVEGFYDF